MSTFEKNRNNKKTTPLGVFQDKLMVKLSFPLHRSILCTRCKHSKNSAVSWDETKNSKHNAIRRD